MDPVIHSQIKMRLVNSERRPTSSGIDPDIAVDDTSIRSKYGRSPTLLEMEPDSPMFPPRFNVFKAVKSHTSLGIVPSS